MTTTEAGRALKPWHVPPKMIAAIEREAAEAARAELRRIIEQRDHDYALHDESISSADSWTDEMMEVYSATVTGVLSILSSQPTSPEHGPSHTARIHATLGAAYCFVNDCDLPQHRPWVGEPQPASETPREDALNAADVESALRRAARSISWRRHQTLVPEEQTNWQEFANESLAASEIAAILARLSADTERTER